MLYLAATPYSASAALVAVREERRAKAASTDQDEAERGQEGLARTATTAREGQPQQAGAPGAGEALSNNQELGAPLP